MKGLRHHYLYGLAVDSGDPQNVIVSASMGPNSANSIEDAESFVYRRDEDGINGSPFQMVSPTKYCDLELSVIRTTNESNVARVEC